jgi:hypothetical protein
MAVPDPPTQPPLDGFGPDPEAEALQFDLPPQPKSPTTCAASGITSHSHTPNTCSSHKPNKYQKCYSGVWKPHGSKRKDFKKMNKFTKVIKDRKAKVRKMTRCEKKAVKGNDR